METVEELQQALQAERELREALEEDLRHSAEAGQILLNQIEALQLQVAELEAKPPPVEEHRPSGRASRQRGSNDDSADGSERPRVKFAVAKDSDSDEEERPAPQATSIRQSRKQRMATGMGRTVMVDDLLRLNMSLEEDHQRLQEEIRQLRETEKSGLSELSPSRRSSMSSIHESDEDEDGLQGKVVELEEELKERSSRIEQLEADMESQRHQLEERKKDKENLNKLTKTYEDLKLALKRAEDDKTKAESALQQAKFRENDANYRLEALRLKQDTDLQHALQEVEELRAKLVTLETVRNNELRGDAFQEVNPFDGRIEAINKLNSLADELGITAEETDTFHETLVSSAPPTTLPTMRAVADPAHSEQSFDFQKECFDAATQTDDPDEEPSWWNQLYSNIACVRAQPQKPLIRRAVALQLEESI